MSMKKLSAGDNIEARCTRCRTVLNHTIVAMVGEKVVWVECNTCRHCTIIAGKMFASPAPLPAEEAHGFQAGPKVGRGQLNGKNGTLCARPWLGRRCMPTI